MKLLRKLINLWLDTLYDTGAKQTSDGISVQELEVNMYSTQLNTTHFKGE